VSEGKGWAYQGDNVIEHMSLTNRHPHKIRVICIHDVDVKMICGYRRGQIFVDEGMGKNGTYNNLVDNG
jgi:hypothetical protein